MTTTRERRGAGSMRRTSCVPSPTAATATAQRFTFVFRDSPRREVAVQRRLVIAEHFDGWPAASIVGECVDANARRCTVAISTARPVTVEAVRGYLADCPHIEARTVEIAAE
ncbi:MAG: hypothetical protein ACKOEM_13765 [Planctomycetia bacterium]